MVGTYTPVGDYAEACALGIIQSTNNQVISAETLVGRNDAIDTAPTQALRSEGGAFIFPTVPDFIRVKAGGNANDDASGTGAQNVIIFGIKEDLTQQIEIVPTAGVDAGASSLNKFWRINLALVGAAGTFRGTNAGVITIEQVGGGGDFLTVAAGESRSECACFSSPKDSTLSIRSVILTVEDAKNVTFDLLFLTGFDVVSSPFPPLVVLSSIKNVVQGIHQVEFRNPLQLPGPADFFVNASTAVSTSAGSAAAAMRLIPNR